MKVDDEHTTEECSPSITPIEVIEESNHVVIPNTQCEDAHVILDHMGLIPPHVQEHESILKVLTIPTLLGASGRKKKTSEPVIDYSKSIILTLDTCLPQLEEKASKKVEVDEARKKIMEEF